ncbi:MAG: 50S ribosomal protein L23 [Thaumarchaeota archaeon]|nr:50S ribosomal protein L23 [Nitrososphaerota archaeon]
MLPEEALKIVIRPYVTEKVFNTIDKENKLAFLVDRKANRHTIREAIETLYEARVVSVNTVITSVGKKAYVRFDPSTSASDLASKLGVV